MSKMDFVDVHGITPGERLADIALQYGYDDPGPIIYFPDNPPELVNLWRNPLGVTYSPVAVSHSFDCIYVPWHPSVIETVIENTERAIHQANIFWSNEIESVEPDASRLKTKLFIVDAAATVLTVAVETQAAARELYHGTVAAAKDSARAAEVTARFWREVKLIGATGAWHSIELLSRTLPESPYNAEYFTRWATPLTPSFFASMAAAAWEGDFDAFAFGEAGVTRKRLEDLDNAWHWEIRKLSRKLHNLKLQLKEPYYQARVCISGAPVYSVTTAGR